MKVHQQSTAQNVQTYRTVLAELSRVSSVFDLVTLTTATDAVTFATADDAGLVGWHTRAVALLAVASLACPSWKTIAEATLALAFTPADLYINYVLK